MEAEADLYDNAMYICMLTIATRKVLHDFRSTTAYAPF
jgi:hypothetical protein